VGVVAQAVEGRGISSRPFLQAEIMAAVPANSPLADRTRVSASALRDVPLLLPPEGSAVRDAVKSGLAKAELRKARMSDVGHGRDAALAAVAAGLGVAFLARFGAAADALFRRVPPGVALRPCGREWKPIRYRLAIRSGRPPGGPAGLLMRELLRSVR
jgi:DNA-binding transcriptional LysR family regulator